MSSIVTNPYGTGWYAFKYGNHYDTGAMCAGDYGNSYINDEGNANVLLGTLPFYIQKNWLPGVGCTMG